MWEIHPQGHKVERKGDLAHRRHRPPPRVPCSATRRHWSSTLVRKMAVILLLGALLAPASALGSEVSCWRLDLDQPIALASEEQDKAICLELHPMCNVPSIEVSFHQDGYDQEAEMCVSLNEIIEKHKWGPRRTRCGKYEHVRFSIEIPSNRTTFVFEIKKPSRFVTHISALPDDRASPTPPPSHGTDSCPGQAPISHETCPEARLVTLAQCAKDSVQSKCCGPCSRDELECLERHEGELEPACRDALRNLVECLMAPRVLLPMEIASVMLLATASFTLLCTILRCCCRRLRGVSGSTSAPSLALEEPFELSDAEDDEDTHAAGGAASAVTSGGGGAGGGAAAPTDGRRAGGRGYDAPKKPTQPSEAEPDNDDDLPAYTQVVEGGALTVQPLYALQPTQLQSHPSTRSAAAADPASSV